MCRDVLRTAEKTAVAASESLLAHREPDERTALTGLLAWFLRTSG